MKPNQNRSIFKNYSRDFFADVDDNLGELPESYDETKIVLMPCESKWAYAYWDISQKQKNKLRQQGGINLSLRLHDVTAFDSNYQNTHKSFEYICRESINNWYLPIPLSDRDYMVEIGYRCIDGKWLSLANSAAVHIPTLDSSDWEEDIFVSIPWTKPLNGQKVNLLPERNGSSLRRRKLSPSTLISKVDSSPYGKIERIPGSITSINPLSSYQFVSGGSGVGMWASGSGLGLMSGKGLMSGVGLMSGKGLISEAVSSSQFWLMANAHLTIYGATMPNAKVTIGNQEIELSQDGTFHFQISFPDGVIDCPIVAVSSDGEHTRSIQMKFDRETNPNPRACHQLSQMTIAAK